MDGLLISKLRAASENTYVCFSLSEKVRIILQCGQFAPQTYTLVEGVSSASPQRFMENAGQASAAFEVSSWLDLLGHRLVSVFLLDHHVLYLFQLLNICRDANSPPVAAGCQDLEDRSQGLPASELPHELAYMYVEICRHTFYN